MASASLHAPFSVLIKANHLVITQTVDSVSRTLCTLDLRQKPSFYLNLATFARGVLHPLKHMQ